jgi:hypothetical protein
MEHDSIQLRLVVKLGVPLPDDQLDNLANVIGKSLAEFLSVTGHEPEGVEVHIHGVLEEGDGGQLH